MKRWFGHVSRSLQRHEELFMSLFLVVTTVAFTFLLMHGYVYDLNQHP